MHPDFESNLMTQFSESLESAGQLEVTSFLPFSEAPTEFHAVLSTMHVYQYAYSIHCTAYLLSMLISSWNKIFNLLINALHYYIIIQKYCFFAVSRNKLLLHKKLFISINC